MTSQIGRRSQVMIGREAVAYGTLSALLQALPVDTITVEEVKNSVQNKMAYGRIESLSKGSAIGSTFANVTIGGIASVKAIGHFLYALFGTLGTGAGTQGYVHTFSVNNTSNEHPSYSIVYKDNVLQKAILGARMNTFKFTIVNQDWVMYEASFIGKSPVADTTTPITYTEEESLVATMATIKMGATIGALGSAMNVASITFNFNKNAEGNFKLGSNTVERVINKEWDVSVDVEMLWEGTTEYVLFTGDTYQALQMQLTTTAVIAGVTPYDLKINIHGGKITKFDVPRPMGDKTMQSFTFQGEYDFTDSKMAQAILNNASAGTVY